MGYTQAGKGMVLYLGEVVSSVCDCYELRIMSNSIVSVTPTCLLKDKKYTKISDFWSKVQVLCVSMSRCIVRTYFHKISCIYFF